MRAKQNICGLELTYRIPDLGTGGLALVWERDRFRYHVVPQFALNPSMRNL